MKTSSFRQRGPHLNALRAFEAAARHGSFSLAADELSVTPGAVAQQIKSLESWANAKLFDRYPQGVKLTNLGREVLPLFVKAFDGLGEAVQNLRSQATPDQISIAALHSVAQLWLSPRLPNIRSLYDNISISVQASEYPPNLKREQFDMSIFLEELPGKSSNIEICRDRIFPVCSPELAKELKRHEDLKGVTFLHDSAWTQDWGIWLQQVSPNHNIDFRGPIFSLYSLAQEEAINGAGVLIAHEPFVQQQIENGQLVAPFSETVDVNSRLAIEVANLDSSNVKIREIIASLLKQ